MKEKGADEIHKDHMFVEKIWRERNINFINKCDNAVSGSEKYRN